MDSPVPASRPPAQNARAALFRWGFFTLALVLYAFVIGTHVGAYAGGSDSSGYLNNARLLQRGQARVEQRVLPGLATETIPSYTYIPLGFIPLPSHEMVPTYPLGLSALFLGVSQLVGWENGPHLTIWLHAVGGIVFFFALAREIGLSFGLALLGATLLAASPLNLFMSVQAMSDTPSLTWCTAALFFAWRSRQRTSWAIAAGVSIALAVLIRPSNLLIVLPVGLSLGRDWRRWLCLGLGGAPGAVFLAVTNLALYGKILTTGYGAVGGIFSWQFAPPSLLSYAVWLPVLLTPLLALILATPWLLRRESPGLLALLAVWVVIFFGFYAFYYHTHEAWWYLRFLLPAFPALIIIMLLALRSLAARWPEKKRLIFGGLAALAVLAWDVTWTRQLSALRPGKDERVYPAAAEWARTHLPANAIVMSMQTTGALLYYSNFTFVRWDQFDTASFHRIERVAAAEGRSICAVFFPFEVEDVIRKKRFAGRWTQLGAVRHVTIWEYAPAAGSEP